MPILQRVDELYVHYHAISFPANAAFEHIGYSKCFRDFAQTTRVFPATISFNRGAADHPQIVNLGKAGKKVVLNSIGEKRVRLLIAKIFERKDGNRFVRWN